MKYAKSTEKVTAGFVEAAMTIYTRVFPQPAAVSALEWCDTNLPGPKNPFSSVWALQAVIDRAQTPSNIDFVMTALADHYRMNIINAGHFVVAHLRDYRNSYIEILKVKKSVRDELLTEWLPRESGIDIAVLVQITKVFSSFENARKYQTAYPGDPEPDLSWQLGLGQSAARAATMIEDLLSLIHI